MKRILLIVALVAVAFNSNAFAMQRTATFGDKNSSGVYRLRADNTFISGANYGFITFAQDTGIVYPYLSTATTNTTLLAQQSGSTIIFGNGSGTAANGTKYTLPAATVGLQYTFISDVAKYFRVDSVSPDIINYSTAIAGSAVNNSGSALAGDSITIFCANAGFWSIKDKVGTWTIDNNP